MSMHPQAIDPIPEETARIARLAFPKGNRYLTLRDELGTIYQDRDFIDLFAAAGQPAIAPWRLVLICVLQFLEDFSVRQAAEVDSGYVDGELIVTSRQDYGIELIGPIRPNVGYGNDSNQIGPFALKCSSCKVLSDRCFESKGVRSQRENEGFSDRKR